MSATADWLAAFAQLDRMPLVDWTTAPTVCRLQEYPTERNHVTEPDPCACRRRCCAWRTCNAPPNAERAEGFVAEAAGDFAALNWAAVAGLAGLSAAHYAAADAVELVPHQ